MMIFKFEFTNGRMWVQSSNKLSRRLGAMSDPRFGEGKGASTVCRHYAVKVDINRRESGIPPCAIFVIGRKLPGWIRWQTAISPKTIRSAKNQMRVPKHVIANSRNEHHFYCFLHSSGARAPLTEAKSSFDDPS